MADEDEITTCSEERHSERRYSFWSELFSPTVAVSSVCLLATFAFEKNLGRRHFDN